MYIDNDRWAGVPFVLRAGKALSERKAEVRLQLRPPPHFIFPGDADAMRNEIVIRLQPDEVRRWGCVVGVVWWAVWGWLGCVAGRFGGRGGGSSTTCSRAPSRKTL